MKQLAHLPEPIPARSANPFATCWTRPGALPFLENYQASVADALIRFEENGYGQITGPHGSGKTTLLRCIARQLVQQGQQIAIWDLETANRVRSRRVPSRRTVLLIDGYELLGVATKARLRLSNRRWIATTHRDLRVPTIADLAPSLELAHALFAQLTQSVATPLAPQAMTASYHRHNGNLRDVWFDLYDQHERLSRTE